MSSFQSSQSMPSRYNDSNKLLNLSSFLSPTKIPFSLLVRGSSSRNRWNSQGDVERVNASDVGLPSDLCNLLSDQPRLVSAMNSLPYADVDSSEQFYEVEQVIAGLARQRHDPDGQVRWRNWALTVTYRSIPWKYLEPVSSDPTVVFPHLKHTLESCPDDFPGLSNTAKIDLGLTLVESSRFPDMAWKHFAVRQSKRLSFGVESPYLASRIALAECLLNRIEGSMLRSAANLAPGSSEETSADERMHSIAGQQAIQRALNFIQIEALQSAEEALEAWRPLTETPSPMEKVVVFRKAMLRGKSLRHRGKFQESTIQLESARRLTLQPRKIVFDEDLRDLICELADSLRESCYLAWAESILRSEIKRREGAYIPVMGKGLLDLSLAEVLFAQGRYPEAKTLCHSAVKDFPRLKFEKICAYIILAKIYHLTSNADKARSYWTMALEVVTRFPSQSSRTSRIILRSLCDVAGQDELRQQYQKQLSRLGAQEEAGDMKFWISGMRHWAEYLQAKSPARFN
ncbi:hypothetical protein QQX98_005819 [Neonectria punicea]|uniref:Uncharacterized protein n=1 Tax=Neonectria punicea TaxID=979145 RepID=A0ABR1H392_9HYPO